MDVDPRARQGLVEYETAADLMTAIDELNGSVLRGLIVHCTVDGQLQPTSMLYGQDNIISPDFGPFFKEGYSLPDPRSPIHNNGDISGQQGDQSEKMNPLPEVHTARDCDVSRPMAANKIW